MFFWHILTKFYAAISCQNAKCRTRHTRSWQESGYPKVSVINGESNRETNSLKFFWYFAIRNRYWGVMWKSDRKMVELCIFVEKIATKTIEISPKKNQKNQKLKTPRFSIAFTIDNGTFRASGILPGPSMSGPTFAILAWNDSVEFSPNLPKKRCLTMFWVQRVYKCLKQTRRRSEKVSNSVHRVGSYSKFCLQSLHHR